MSKTSEEVRGFPGLKSETWGTQIDATAKTSAKATAKATADPSTALRFAQDDKQEKLRAKS
jgi:hypothetical protein